MVGPEGLEVIDKLLNR